MWRIVVEEEESFLPWIASSAKDFAFFPEKQQHHLPSANHVQLFLFAELHLLSPSDRSLWHMQFGVTCWVTEIPLCNWPSDTAVRHLKESSSGKNLTCTVIPRPMVNEPHNEWGGNPRVSKALTLNNKINVKACDMHGRPHQGFGRL